MLNLFTKWTSFTFKDSWFPDVADVRQGKPLQAVLERVFNNSSRCHEMLYGASNMSVRVRETDCFGLGFQKVVECCKQANKT